MLKIAEPGAVYQKGYTNYDVCKFSRVIDDEELIRLIGYSGKEDHCSVSTLRTDSGWMECPDDEWCDTMYFGWYLPFLDTREVDEFQI
jgi:hypothetical protein